MGKAGIQYVRQDTCFPWIEDSGRAQKLMDQQVKQNWAKTLQTIAGHLNPVHREISRHYRVNYYWTTHESEWAIDVRFERQEELKRFYPLLLQHGIITFGSPDVLRFLGRAVKVDACQLWRRTFHRPQTQSRRGPHQTLPGRQLGQGLWQSLHRSGQHPACGNHD
jgi:hypothetical protein